MKKFVEILNRKVFRSDKIIFDEAFYLSSYPDVAAKNIRPLRHYMSHGWKEGRQPHSLFDPNWYLKQNPDVLASGIEPLTHYSKFGWREGRKPHPLFDPVWYLKQNPDVQAAGWEPLAHYMNHGWREGRKPHADSGIRFVLDHLPEAPMGKISPSIRYLSDGARPVASSHRSEGADVSGAIVHHSGDSLSAEELSVTRPHFDPVFYRNAYPDIAGDDEQLLLHYMSFGWREGRDPNPEFSTSFYLDQYPDIRDSGSNPFLHYVVFGIDEGRRVNRRQVTKLRYNLSASLTPGHLSSVALHSQPLPAKEPRARSGEPLQGQLDIHWIIPDFARGGGGHMTIFRMVRFLELFGHRCTIWIESSVFNTTPESAWQEAVKHYQCVGSKFAFVEDGFFEASGDVVIATGWSTAYLADRAIGFTNKFYFVQDHEPEFYATGSEHILARQSYHLNLNTICASPWLSSLMTSRYGRWSRYFYLSHDPAVYKVLEERRAGGELACQGRVKIAVYARDHTPRRCVSLALMALEQLGRQRQDFEVHFFGNDRLPFAETNFRSYDHGILDANGLAELYNECDLGICFSATNYSLVPQEMMACGLPIVELDVESTREIFGSGVVTFGGPEPIDIAHKIAYLMDRPELRIDQSRTALNWVNQFTWEEAARKVESALHERISETATLNTAVSVRKDVKMDVVIPTYNGIDEIKRVVHALRHQVNKDEMQVHCIDSGSSDGTREWLIQQADVSLTSIRKEEFQHGRTRNQAAALGRAPFIAFLTQDATPATCFWSKDILMMMERSPRAAGLFGRHIAYPKHPEYVRDEIRQHFSNMLNFPLLLSKDTDPLKWESGDKGWRQILHFYSDNNSCMRRSIWNAIPYPEIEYGEDQVWADTIIKEGYEKIYSPTATVFHSHDYGPEETYTRSHIEGMFFYNHFGYVLCDKDDDDILRTIRAEQQAFRVWAHRRAITPADFDRRLASISAKYYGWRDGLRASNYS